MQKGSISVHTENIFPIIKKFLYSNHEIFLRELISNAVDATRKLNALSSIGEFKGEIGENKIKVSIDEKAKTLTISDRGIGLTADEMEKYINQIAFSGAEEFLEKYKDKTETGIIGHFGLGFYSAFMVAKTVEIQSLSYKEGAEAAHWTCDGTTQYTIDKGNRSERGTDIILHIAEDSEEFLQNFRIRELLNKYCKFLPVEIEFEEKVINNTHPLWVKKPADLKEQDYLDFYNELYPFSEPPLFWIHLNVDYPFNLTGVLYFPRVKKDVEIQRNKILLYSNQVFVTDDVREIVPEFLMLLHGVIDSPDIPLNVSRSFLQADANVKKITSHITKKVADKLEEIFKNDRKVYEEKWEGTGLFVKYGIVSDEKFADKAGKLVLLKNAEGQYFTIEEYKEKVKIAQTNKDNKIVFLYANDAQNQHSFIENAAKRAYDVLILDEILDNHFIGWLESKHEDIKVFRVDADSIDKLVDKDEKRESVLSEDDLKKLKSIYENLVSDKKWEVETEAQSPDDQFLTITMPEFERRMKEMAQMSGGSNPFFGFAPEKYKVIVNANHRLASKLKSLESDESKALAKQALNLALLQQGMLKGAELAHFIKETENRL